jgi:hypothetical protein
VQTHETLCIGLIVVVVLIFGSLTASHLFAQAKPSHVSSYTGNDFITYCPSAYEATPAAPQNVACIEFTEGYFAAFKDAGFVLPPGTTSGRVYDVVAQFIHNNPSERDKKLRTLIKKAIYAAWPQN